MSVAPAIKLKLRSKYKQKCEAEKERSPKVISPIRISKQLAERRLGGHCLPFSLPSSPPLLSSFLTLSSLGLKSCFSVYGVLCAVGEKCVVGKGWKWARLSGIPCGMLRRSLTITNIVTASGVSELTLSRLTGNISEVPIFSAER